MTEAAYLSPEIRAGLDAARARAYRRGRGLRVHVGGAWYPIQAMDEDGFEVALDVAPKLRGHVEIHDGARVVRSALVVAGEVRGGAMHYVFKRVTTPRAEAALDYVRVLPATAGLIEFH